MQVKYVEVTEVRMDRLSYDKADDAGQKSSIAPEIDLAPTDLVR